MPMVEEERFVSKLWVLQLDCDLSPLLLTPSDDFYPEISGQLILSVFDIRINTLYSPSKRSPLRSINTDIYLV
jgi:hypothetical protein